jgi:hypothetical protein
MVLGDAPEPAGRCWSPASPDVHKSLTELQLIALETLHPHEYKVRIVSDALEIAVAGQRRWSPVNTPEVQAPAVA